MVTEIHMLRPDLALAALLLFGAVFLIGVLALIVWLTRKPRE